MNGMYWSVGRLRESADTMPAVTVLSRPKGLPMAATHSPTLSWLESPIFSAGKSFASIFTTAISVCLSVPRTLPSNSRLSVRRTTILSAPSTTCAFVRMSPSVQGFLAHHRQKASEIQNGGKSRHLVHPCRGNRNLAWRRCEHFS